MRRTRFHAWWLLAAAACLAGCADRELANRWATVWEAAEAIRQGKDAALPVRVIQDTASASAAAAGFPYPPKKDTP